MKKKGHRPITKVKNPEPKMDDPDWIIWAAWADRITFEEIEKKTGKKESDVIKITVSYTHLTLPTTVIV